VKAQIKAERPPSPGRNPDGGSSFRRRRRFSRGQTAVIRAAALPALLGSVAMSTDVAILYYNWSILRKAVDAAALAGAAYLPNFPTTASSTAKTYGTENGINASDTVSATVSGDDKSITMTATRTVPYYFGKMIGLQTASLSATATAQIEPVGSATNLIPLGFDPPTAPQEYQMYTFKGGQVGAGNWGALALGGNGGNTYRNNLENGYSGTVNIGDYVTTETGQLTGPTKQGIDYRMTEGVSVDPSIPAGQTISSSTSYSLSDPRVVEVPVVNWGNINGKSEVQVLGFAMMWLVSTDGKSVNAQFIQQVAADNTPDPNATPCTGVSQVCDAYSPMLTQ
jgi:Flp pilus assembly protein TadG